MAEQLASMPEESTADFTAPYPPTDSYRESIRSVAWPEWPIRSTLFGRLFPQSGQSGSISSSYSGASTTYLSNISSGSSGLVSADVWDFGAGELRKIAHDMIRDGYIQRMVQAFSGQPDSVLQTWFIELDVPWVLQSRESHGSQLQIQPQELVERWIRSFTLIVVTIKEMAAAGHVTPAVAQFGKASISAMLDFVHTCNLSMAEKLQAMLPVYRCVSTASYDMCMVIMISGAQNIYDLLVREENKLIQAISDMIMEAKMAFVNDDDSWAIEIMQGGGDVHWKVRLLGDCIVWMRKAQASSQNRPNTEKLPNLIHDTMGYLKNLLDEKSELCSDPSLRYMFLLNNSYFVEQLSKPFLILFGVDPLCVNHLGLELTPECEKLIDSYLKVSWGYVLSCIPKSNFHGPIRGWINSSTLAKFQSEFHKTYQAQKFWKVPDPRLRSLLREIITKRVISGYRDYLKEHPELEKQVSCGNSSPEVLEEMLGELFEG